MSFEHYARDAEELEHQIAMLGVALGIDWEHGSAVRALAREALQGGAAHIEELVRSADASQRAKGELFALGVMMLRTMETSAEEGIHTHGGPCWKAFGRALIEEAGAARTRPKDGGAS
jgi:hypothetical protein